MSWPSKSSKLVHITNCKRTSNEDEIKKEKNDLNIYSRYLHKFLSLPYLSLQRESLRIQVEANERDIASMRQELDLYFQSEESNYDSFSGAMAQKRRQAAEEAAPAATVDLVVGKQFDVKANAEAVKAQQQQQAAAAAGPTSLNPEVANLQSAMAPKVTTASAASTVTSFINSKLSGVTASPSPSGPTSLNVSGTKSPQSLSAVSSSSKISGGRISPAAASTPKAAAAPPASPQPKASSALPDALSGLTMAAAATSSKSPTKNVTDVDSFVPDANAIDFFLDEPVEGDKATNGVQEDSDDDDFGGNPMVKAVKEDIDDVSDEDNAPVVSVAKSDYEAF